MRDGTTERTESMEKKGKYEKYERKGECTRKIMQIILVEILDRQDTENV